MSADRQACLDTIPNQSYKYAICTALEADNELRIRHGVPKFSIDATLCDHADSYAKKLGPLAHDADELNRYSEGENLFAGWSWSAPAGPELRFLQG